MRGHFSPFDKPTLHCLRPYRRSQILSQTIPQENSALFSPRRIQNLNINDFKFALCVSLSPPFHAMLASLKEPALCSSPAPKNHRHNEHKVNLLGRKIIKYYYSIISNRKKGDRASDTNTTKQMEWKAKAHKKDVTVFTSL